MCAPGMVARIRCLLSMARAHEPELDVRCMINRSISAGTVAPAKYEPKPYTVTLWAKAISRLQPFPLGNHVRPIVVAI